MADRQAQTPRGINHVVLNVRDIEVSHRFWTEIMGFRCVAELKPRPDRVHVDDDVVPLGERALDLALRLGELLAQEPQEGLETLDAVRRIGVVLHVAAAEVLGGGLEILLVDRLLVELDDELLVGLFLGVGAGDRGDRQDESNRNQQNAPRHGLPFPARLEIIP